MTARLRRCVECPKCRTRYLIAASPYSNGSYLLPAAGVPREVYQLYCSCGRPAATSQWKSSDLKTYVVSKAAHDRGYGTPNEIVAVEQASALSFGRADSSTEAAARRRATRMSRLWKCILSGVACALIGLCGWNLLVAQSTVGQPSQSAACTTPEHRQFDFWVGDWDVFDIDNPNTVVARTHVDLILGGCVLREDYQDMNGMSGQSFSIYDATHKTWHQSWVTNRGQLLLLDGQMEGRQMRLHATDRTQDGKERQVRGSWEAVPGGVRETAVRSVDDGKTWQPWFDLMFRPHKP